MKKPTQQEFGRRLAALRRKAGLTQDEVARSLGITSLTLSRHERGVQWPDFGVLVSLAQIYDVGLGELFDITSSASASREDEAIAEIVARLRTQKLPEIRRAGKVLRALFEPVAERSPTPKKKRRAKSING